MDSTAIVVATIIVTSGLTIAIGGYGPSRAEGDALRQALDSIARQPDEADRITRTLFVGMAMVESVAIYSFVIVLILLFANPLLELLQ